MGPALPGKPAQCHHHTWVWRLPPAQTLPSTPGTRRNSSLLLAWHLRPFNGASPANPLPSRYVASSWSPEHGPPTVPLFYALSLASHSAKPSFLLL